MAIKRAGVHLICEFWQIQWIESTKKILKILKESAEASNSTVVGKTFYKFKPHGFSAAVLLAESHISLHYWPERNYLAIDIFTCGKTKPYKALEVLRENFKPKSVQIIEIKRGIK